jgi:RNAse H domain protein, YqgF family
VATIVVGQPIDLRGNMSEVENDILKFVDEVRRLFPTLEIKRFDERFTSKMASYFISQSGKNKKQREQKSLIDKVSATIILQNYLDTIG